MTWLMIALGFVILIFAGDILVRGAVNLALRLGMPALIVSLTIVAFGTSAPELLIVIEAVNEGAAGLAIGNIVGSNTANVLLVLGVPALLAGLNTGSTDARQSFAMMVAATVLFIVLATIAPFVWWHGAIFLAVLTAMMWQQAVSEPQDEEPEGADETMPKWKIAAFLIGGLIGLPIGANILVDNAIVIAQDFGVSDAAIGLTLVAVGTSLPELATTVMAAYRKQADVALGNVIGSNLFNLLGVVGVAALLDPVPIKVDQQFLDFDLWVMLAASILLAPFVFLRWNLGRAWGLGFVALYAIYMVTIFS